MRPPAEILPMTRLINTLLSFVFFIIIGGALFLVAPRLAETWLPASGLTSAIVPSAPKDSLFAETRMPDLAVPRQSDAPAEPGPGAESHSFAFGTGNREWWGFNGAKAGKPAPVILLLHASGRSGRDMLAPWQEVARREGLVLVAPDAADSAAWSRAQDGDAFLAALLEEAARVYPVDPERVYMFGHSAGANFALTLAGDPPKAVRAIAGHAGADLPADITPGPLPIRIYIGDSDRIFPLDRVRAAAEALAEAGHPTDLVVIPGHDHWFYDAAPAIAADAWAWFATK